MSKKAKVIAVAILLILAAVGDVFLSTWLHLTLKGRFTGVADLRISSCIQSLAADQNHRLMYLMILLVLACALVALFLMERGKEDYASDTIQITDKISIPVPIGQGQHGNAKFLDKKEYDRIFAAAELEPGSKKIADLIMHGYDDLEKEEKNCPKLLSDGSREQPDPVAVETEAQPPRE